MSLYRFAVFGVKGFSEFTRSGFESAAKKFNPDDLNVDLSDQHIMITGANSVFNKQKNSIFIYLFSL
jgi:dehydrogenase/reductase SDR family protein 12